VTEKLTLKKVAEKLGVSRTTVSNAYNRPDQLSEDLRARIIKEASALGYQGPDPAGRLLRTGKTDTLGMIFYDQTSEVFHDEMAMDLMRGVTRVCEDNGISLLLIPTKTTNEGNTNCLRALVDGFLVYSAFIDVSHNAVSAILTRSLPTVGIDQRLSNMPMVGIDDEEGGHLAAKHLVDNGHKDIAIIGFYLHRDGQTGVASEMRIETSLVPTCTQRLMGYRRGFREAGLDSLNMPFYETQNGSYEQGFEAAMTALQQPNRPSALLCMSDVFAKAAMDAAHQLKLRVPEDLSIVGFDGVQSGQTTALPLTTVRQSGRAKGEAATKILLGLAPKEDVILPIELVEGKTVAPPSK